MAIFDPWEEKIRDIEISIYLEGVQARKEEQASRLYYQSRGMDVPECIEEDIERRSKDPLFKCGYDGVIIRF